MIGDESEIKNESGSYRKSEDQHEREMVAEATSVLFFAYPAVGAMMIVPPGAIMVATHFASSAAGLGPEAHEVAMGLSMVFGGLCGTVSLIAVAPRILRTSDRIASKLSGRTPPFV